MKYYARMVVLESDGKFIEFNSIDDFIDYAYDRALEYVDDRLNILGYTDHRYISVDNLIIKKGKGITRCVREVTDFYNIKIDMIEKINELEDVNDIAISVLYLIVELRFSTDIDLEPAIIKSELPFDVMTERKYVEFVL